jgi:hypothetical protein
MIPGPCGCLGLGIRKGAKRMEKREGKGRCRQTEEAGKRQWLPRAIT